MILHAKNKCPSPCGFREEDSLKCPYFCSIFSSCDLIMQRTGTIWTNLVGDLLRNIHAKFGDFPIGSFKEDVFENCWRRTTNAGRLTTTDIGWSQKLTLALCARWAKNTICTCFTICQNWINWTIIYLHNRSLSIYYQLGRPGLLYIYTTTLYNNRSFGRPPL